ncbi:hypothetical protein V6N13_078593 [Hibiscus sabdariffa]
MTVNSRTISKYSMQAALQLNLHEKRVDSLFQQAVHRSGVEVETLCPPYSTSSIQLSGSIVDRRNNLSSNQLCLSSVCYKY